MKFFVFILFALLSNCCLAEDFTLLASHSEPVNKEDCSCKGKKLYGTVKVVEYGADLEVEIVEYGADLEVEIVEYGATDCGEWKFVEYGADFTIKFVEYGADFTIKFVEYAPGIR